MTPDRVPTEGHKRGSEISRRKDYQKSLSKRVVNHRILRTGDTGVEVSATGIGHLSPTFRVSRTRHHRDTPCHPLTHLRRNSRILSVRVPNRGVAQDSGTTLKGLSAEDSQTPRGPVYGEPTCVGRQRSVVQQTTKGIGPNLDEQVTWVCVNCDRDLRLMDRGRGCRRCGL